jgi:hypothetical protein
MATDSYWQTISDKAARDSFKSSDPFGNTLFSLESNPSESVPSIFTYAAEHRDSFLKLLEVLSLVERREIAIEYIILRKTEQQIATLHGRKSQSMMGREIAFIVKVLGAALILGVNPPESLLASVFTAESLSMPDFRDRKSLRQARKKLASSRNLKSIACGEYLENLLSHPTRASRSRISRLRNRTYRDPAILGSFDINLRHPKIGVLFTPRAGQVSNASQI